VSRPDPNQSPASPPAAADGSVDPSTAAELARLRTEVSRLEEENRAYVRAMRHMTSAAEEVLADARREAAETRARVAAEAYERLTVARADARAAVYEERRRLAAELELLAAVREKITEERTTLTQFHSQLNGRLRQLVHAMVEFTDRSPELAAGPPVPVANGAHTTNGSPATNGSHASNGAHGPHAPAAAANGSQRDDVIDAVAAEETDLGAVRRDGHPLLENIDAHDEELEEAFAAFFSADIDMEPSRTWILNDQ
jgi:hypothetical protein